MASKCILLVQKQMYENDDNNYDVIELIEMSGGETISCERFLYAECSFFLRYFLGVYIILNLNW